MPSEGLAVLLPGLTGGGAERVMLDLCRGFHQRGHSVDLLIGQVRGEFAQSVPPGVDLVDLGTHFRMTTLGAGAWRIAAYLRRRRPAALLAALEMACFSAVLGGRLARTGTRIVVSQRNHITVARQLGGSLGMRMSPVLARFLYPRADGVTAVSAGVAEELASLTHMSLDRIAVLPNPVVTPELHELADARPEHPWFSDGGAPVVLGAGRLHPQKDFGTLIRAVALARERRACRLMIIGEGSLRDSLTRLAADLNLGADFALPGFQRNPFACMRHASVFVLSSRCEGMPGVLVQAMACGCPVVSTDCRSGPAGLLNCGALAPLVPVGDAGAMAEGICKALDGEQDTNALREQAERHSFDRSVEAYLAVLLPSRG